MKKILFVFIFLLILTWSLPTNVFADEMSSVKSANFADINTGQKQDHRIEILKKYLEHMQSPLAPYARDFIVQADAYNLPWSLVAAISGTESTFGKAVPANCNNAWGFGIYSDQTTCFDSYPQAIQTVSKSLRENYINKWGSRNVEDIGRYYAASD